LDAQPKYKLAVVDQVLRDLGCDGGRHGAGWRWKSPSSSRPGHFGYFTYFPDAACTWILQNDLYTGAERLEKDPDEVIHKTKRAGGEYIGP